MKDKILFSSPDCLTWKRVSQKKVTNLNTRSHQTKNRIGKEKIFKWTWKGTWEAESVENVCCCSFFSDVPLAEIQNPNSSPVSITRWHFWRAVQETNNACYPEPLTKAWIPHLWSSQAWLQIRPLHFCIFVCVGSSSTCRLWTRQYRDAELTSCMSKSYAMDSFTTVLPPNFSFVLFSRFMEESYSVAQAVLEFNM